MNTRGRIVLLLFAVLPLALATASLHAQVDQHVLAQQLLSGTAEDRSQALERARRLGPQKMGEELRTALIALLERNNRIVAEAAKRNEAVATFESPEFIAHVAHVVSQLQEPRAIRALAGALATGSTLVPDALAEFGEPAVAPVLRVVTSPESPDEAVGDGLLSLRFMAEGKDTRPLSAASLNEIRHVARRRLTGKQYFTTLWRAIDLAVALNDAELRRVVESMAADRDEVVARGIEDPHLIEQTQKLAADRLAGVSPLPRYRSHAERARLLDPRRPR